MGVFFLIEEDIYGLSRIFLDLDSSSEKSLKMIQKNVGVVFEKMEKYFFFFN